MINEHVLQHKASGWWWFLVVGQSPSVQKDELNVHIEARVISQSDLYGCKTRFCLCHFLCPTGALQHPGCPPGLSHQPQRVQLPPADHTDSRSEHRMAGRLQPAGVNLWRNTTSRLGPGPKDSRLTHESHTSLHSCSLSLRASGCGLTVKVSITPIGTYLLPPAATLASTYAPPVSPSVSFVWGAPSASL